MIPGIEEILHGLLAGKYTEEQCIAWLNTHMELAADRDGLRDHFAAHAPPRHPSWRSDSLQDSIDWRWWYADKMLKARATP